MKAVLTIVGAILLVLSAPIGALTPFIPIGLPMAIAGLVLIGRNTRLGKGWIVRTARRNRHSRKLYLSRLRPILGRSSVAPR